MHVLLDDMAAIRATRFTLALSRYVRSCLHVCVCDSSDQVGAVITTAAATVCSHAERYFSPGNPKQQ